MKKLFFVVCSVLLASVLSCKKADKKVLCIFSYHAEYPWVRDETAGVESVLKKGVLVDKFYMDTKRNTSPEWKKKVTGEAVGWIETFRPDIVIVFDDNACSMVAKKYIGKDLPFVFCGVNADPGDYGLPCANITGVVEREHKAATIGLLNELAPGVKKVAFLTDGSPTSKKFIARLRETDLPVEVAEIVTTDDFDTWKETLKRFQSDADALGLFLYHTVKENGREESLPAGDVLKWTLENNRLPEFAFFDFVVKGGALCGDTISGIEQGRAAAETAALILAGRKPSSIPVRHTEKGDPMVNAARAKELGITIPPSVAKKAEILH